MYLDFHYGSNEATITTHGDTMSVALTNHALDAHTERWSIPKGVSRTGTHFQFIESADSILGAASVEVTNSSLSALSYDLFKELLTTRPDFSLHRIWNFIPKINHCPKGALENYQAFCQGRAIAFEKHTASPNNLAIPAASAVGTNGNRLSVIFMAGRHRAEHLENPRQTPAYEYPTQYGPKAPTFSRGSIVPQAVGPNLFISGTSSVLASESIGDTIEHQLQVTLENLAIIETQSAAKNAFQKENSPRTVRVYIRNKPDFAYIKQTLEAKYLRPNDKAYYIVADICRAELLVEIEATLFA